MTTAGLMYCVEFFADKTPGVDTAWDSVHTFIRIPLGAVLAMSAIGETTPAVELAAFLVGGSLTAATRMQQKPVDVRSLIRHPNQSAIGQHLWAKIFWLLPVFGQHLIIHGYLSAF